MPVLVATASACQGYRTQADVGSHEQPIIDSEPPPRPHGDAAAAPAPTPSCERWLAAVTYDAQGALHAALAHPDLGAPLALASAAVHPIADLALSPHALYVAEVGEDETEALAVTYALSAGALGPRDELASTDGRMRVGLSSAGPVVFEKGSGGARWRLLAPGAGPSLGAPEPRSPSFEMVPGELTSLALVGGEWSFASASLGPPLAALAPHTLGPKGGGPAMARAFAGSGGAFFATVGDGYDELLLRSMAGPSVSISLPLTLLRLEDAVAVGDHAVLATTLDGPTGPGGWLVMVPLPQAEQASEPGAPQAVAPTLVPVASLFLTVTPAYHRALAVAPACGGAPPRLFAAHAEGVSAFDLVGDALAPVAGFDGSALRGPVAVASSAFE